VVGKSCTSGGDANWYERSLKMGTRKKHPPEQIVSLLREIEVGRANGKMTPQVWKEVGITEQTYYRKEYGGFAKACEYLPYAGLLFLRRVLWALPL
jgi:hypothetical protein